MTYRLFLLPRAQKELARLPTETYERLRAAIHSLAEDPRPPGCRKLTGREGWRIRVGDFRVIFEIEDDLNSVTVLHIGHRRDVYR